jgi:glycosyltransferase involved in cell wall biosynthesis
VSKKILFLSGIQLFPPESGGQLRSAGLCQSLAELGHEVRIFSATGRKSDYLCFKKSSEVAHGKGLIEYTDRGIVKGFLQWLAYRLKRPPLWLFWPWLFWFARRLWKEFKWCDQVIVDFPFLYRLGLKAQKPLIINTHNAEFELHDEFRELVRQIEIESFKKAQGIIFCHDGDRDKFKEWVKLEDRSYIIPNGVDIGRFHFPEGMRQKLREEFNVQDRTVYLFSASQYGPNKEAFGYLEKFCREHEERLLELKILIIVVGTVCLKTRKTRVMEVHGRVEKIEPYFALADLSLNPVIEGSGVNVKMLEALAAMLPIMSTEFGMRGLVAKNVVIFERDRLLEAMVEEQKSELNQRRKRAQAAYEENLDKIDMKRSIKNIPLFVD